MIFYHGTPFHGGSVNAIKCLNGRDAMVSFIRQDDLRVAAEICRTVVLDNGAFSAWRSCNPITDWSNFYDCGDFWRLHPTVEWCCIPDDIDGGEKENDMLLSEWPFGLFGVPVYHIHEDVSRFGRLADKFPRIALGSSGIYSKIGNDKWWQRMGEIMNYICDDQGRPAVKLHGLRMLDPSLLAHLPLSSADSTNVVRNMGMDVKWKGNVYAPTSPSSRALVIMDRLEAHATASVWNGTMGNQLNFELLDCNEAM